MALSITAACSRAGRFLTRRSGVPYAGRGRKRVSTVTAVTVVAALVPTAAMMSPAQAAPVQQGFNLNASDLRYILRQIKIAEHHAATATPANRCGTLMGPGEFQIPTTANGEELPWGLRTVDGTCNNLLPGQWRYGSADNAFPRLTDPEFKDAEPNAFGPPGGAPTSYKQKKGDVFDSQPRVISNLVVDQTNHNPAAVAAAGADPSAPKSNQSLFVPNVAPDVGLSAPFNSVFTFFGQFFDHGLDLVTKQGGTVYMPLKPDDPLYVPGSHTNFMALTRSQNQPGPDGILGDNANTPVDESADDEQEATNTTATFVDQSQTYGSHASQQVFLRAYAKNAAGKPVSTGALLEGGPDGGMATWAGVKAQARDLLGIALTDEDVLSIPTLKTDPYGRFIPGPNGFPQIQLAAGGTLEGNPQAPVSTAGAVPTGHAFLDDIAHNAVPGMADHDHNPGTPMVQLTPDDGGGITGPQEQQTPGTYDNEMLDAHFVAGDGRVNENIGLTSVHQIFHSEHNRLAENINGLINSGTAADRAAWHDRSNVGAWNYNERIFQAARFVTEMEYQHLAFEEFVRKVQPMVNLFGEGGGGYETDIDPAISAEFAHAVYRFGHSMLTETVERKNADGTSNNLSLIQAFLNPPAYSAGYSSPEAAAGSVFRGMSRQVGNEIDEFVTGALRSNLLGLPLDLAAINMARAREAGVPSLNDARRQFFADTNNSALKPYSSWADFSFNLKHAESLVNFVAAYGSHPSITGTTAQRREAAHLLVDPPVGTDPTTIPADATDFMNSTGTWAGRESGINEVDLWVGGLAEKRVIFGGLLGSTFNYVFEKQMEDLQFGDRFYYLSRTAGLNLLTQLEGNSFSELVMRNTDVEGLPADIFSRPDFILNVGRLGETGPILDDPTTGDEDNPIDESDKSSAPGKYLSRVPAGTLRYGGPEHVVFNGTDGADRMWASEGDDTIRGNDGDDWMEGGDGIDNLFGGVGDDILTDLFGDDVLRGGDGDDALSSGQGFGADLNQGGRGKDFIVGGNDAAETFAGPGDDFVFAGQGEDVVFGDDGDDWIEGGDGPFNLLQGDAGAPFLNDLDQPGNDVIAGNGGEQNFDSEGGDDIMLAGPGIQRAEGMNGFDWVTHKGDPQPANSDMQVTGLLPPAEATLRDRFDVVEALSGWNKDDVLRGDDGIPLPFVGQFPADKQVLTAEGIALIDGLAALLPNNATSFDAGDILLGGAGADVMEGRGEDDRIDGDAWLDVRLKAPDPANPGQFQFVNSMQPLRDDVMQGRIDPGAITIERTIRPGSPGTDMDTAVFSDISANYDCQVGNGASEPCSLLAPNALANGPKVVVTHVNVPPGTEPEEDVADDGAQGDGIDTLTNVEQLVFADTVPPGKPTIGEATAGNQSATVTWTAPFTGAVTGYDIKVIGPSGQVGGLRAAPGNRSSAVVTGLSNAVTYRFQVRARNAAGPGEFSNQSNPVTPAATVPAAPTITATEAGSQRATVHWAEGDDGGEPITRYQVRVTDERGVQVGTLRNASATANRLTVTGLRNGRTYWFEVRATNRLGNGLFSALSDGVTPGTLPSAPRIGTASARDDAALVTWQAPLNDGGLGVNDYRIRVVNPAGNQVGPLRTVNAVSTSARVGNLVDGRAYRFQVLAMNEMGSSPYSAMSNRVVPGTRPGAPRIRRASPGPRGGRLTATARWAAPRAVPVPRLTGYTVVAMRMQSRAADANVLRRFRSPVLRPGRTQRRFVLPAGIYRFQVVAWNAIGRSQLSRPSSAVRAR
jgi:Ca2+-binding RTX toxin-like protein